jgi:hypothetical protein
LGLLTRAQEEEAAEVEVMAVAAAILAEVAEVISAAEVISVGVGISAVALALAVGCVLAAHISAAYVVAAGLEYRGLRGDPVFTVNAPLRVEAVIGRPAAPQR